MIKRVFSWAKTSELWINLAQIYAVILCFFIVHWRMKGVDNIEKFAGPVTFLFLIILAYRYSLYKRVSFWLFAVFFAFTYVQGFLEKVPLKSVFGSPVQRNWYICLFVLTIGAVLKDKRKEIWSYTVCAVQTAILSVVFSLSICQATMNLIDSDYKVLKGLGTFINGRLSTFSSANSAGPAALVLILLSLILIYRSKEFKIRGLLYILYGLSATIGTVALSLSRSRGAMIAAASGIGCFFFILAYDKFKEKRPKGLLAGMFACLTAIILSIVLFIVPRYLYDALIDNYAESHYSAESERIKENLEVYGLTYSLENLTDRTDIWRAEINMMSEKPQRWLWGVTPQRIAERPVIDIYPGRPELISASAHNGYMQQLLLYGIPGASVLALILLIWITRSVKAVFSGTVPTRDKLFVAMICAVCVNAMAESFLFPIHVLYIISFNFFVAEGCLEGSMEKKEATLKKRILIVVGILSFFILAGLLARHFYLADKAKYDEVKPIVKEEQRPEDYVRLNNGITKEMMAADYWIKLRVSQGADIESERLSQAEIERFNNLNKRMLSTGAISFSLWEIGDDFYYKTGKSFVEDIMPEIKIPGDYFVEGEATDEAYWEALKENANLDSLNERISVRFGISVAGTILKRFPTDDKVFRKNNNLYYDELAQSDLLPFMPVAILHESKDAKWYYVITYGYGGWVRKEYVALCESKEDWLNRANPENFLVVTGRELRLSSDPYTEKLSGMIVPMATKLPLASLEEIPEDIHNRISYGNYVVKLPVRNEAGKVQDEFVLIPIYEDVNIGYLPYTEENVCKLAFKHLGAVYGWAGDNNGQDCSGYTREIFGCFGYRLPRTAKAQAEMECTGSYDVSNATLGERLSILKDAPAGTLLYFPGHIMLYLGTENGRPYCISSTGNFATDGMQIGESKEVNTVILTDMLDTVKADGNSWIESVKTIVIP